MTVKYDFEKRVFENKRRKADEFAEIALQIRRDIIKSLAMAGSGHSGGSLGITDLLSVIYFGGYMKYDPNDYKSPDRDRFLLSAGHLCPAQYAALARAGFFPVDELATLRKYGGRLQGHPGLDMGLPGIEASTGSLGQGISIALGMAMSDKLVDRNERKVLCLTGDGEIQEGSVWETAMAAGNFGLDNLCWIIDNNDCQIDGRVRDVMSVYPIEDKFEAFNFNVTTIDGHDYSQICDALDKFEENRKNSVGKPTVIVAKTKMGKGVSFMEDKYQWHGIPPKPDEAEKALDELVSSFVS